MNKKKENNWPPLPEDLQPYAEGVFALIDSVFSDAALPKIDNASCQKRNLLNDNFHRAEFQELWIASIKKLFTRWNLKHLSLSANVFLL